MNKHAVQSTAPLWVQGIKEIAGNYDAFIVDLWGVAHNGLQLYPHVLNCFQEMRSTGKKIWLLSNAPRSSATVQARLRELGLGDAAYDGIVTSGDGMRRLLEKDFAGKSFYFIGNEEKDSSVYQGLPLNSVPQISNADFLLVTGIWKSVEAYHAELSQALEHKLTLYCANPDRVVHVGEHLALCAGSLADAYLAMGGKVVWMGKPYVDVYKMVCENLDPAARVCAIGDSLITDIQGAQTYGIDSVLITQGIHRDDFAHPDSMADFIENSEVAPKWLLETLKW